jgi:hypothetical protein
MPLFDTDATIDDSAGIKGRTTMDGWIGINIFDVDATINDSAGIKGRTTMDGWIGINTIKSLGVS